MRDLQSGPAGTETRISLFTGPEPSPFQAGPRQLFKRIIQVYTQELGALREFSKSSNRK